MPFFNALGDVITENEFNTIQAIELALSGKLTLDLIRQNLENADSKWFNAFNAHETRTRGCSLYVLNEIYKYKLKMESKETADLRKLALTNALYNSMLFIIKAYRTEKASYISPLLTSVENWLSGADNVDDKHICMMLSIHARTLRLTLASLSYVHGFAVRYALGTDLYKELPDKLEEIYTAAEAKVDENEADVLLPENEVLDKTQVNINVQLNQTVEEYSSKVNIQGSILGKSIDSENNTSKISEPKVPYENETKPIDGNMNFQRAFFISTIAAYSFRSTSTASLVSLANKQIKSKGNEELYKLKPKIFFNPNLIDNQELLSINQQILKASEDLPLKQPGAPNGIFLFKLLTEHHVSPRTLAMVVLMLAGVSTVVFGAIVIQDSLSLMPVLASWMGALEPSSGIALMSVGSGLCMASFTLFCTREAKKHDEHEESNKKLISPARHPESGVAA